MTTDVKRMISSLCWTLAAAAVLAVGANAAGLSSTSSTPAQYRGHVNAICRGYTARFKPMEADLKRTGGW